MKSGFVGKSGVVFECGSNKEPPLKVVLMRSHIENE